MFWIALELSIPKIGLNIMLSLTVKKLHAFKFDGVAEPDNDNTGNAPHKQNGRRDFRFRLKEFSIYQASASCVSGCVCSGGGELFSSPPRKIFRL